MQDDQKTKYDNFEPEAVTYWQPLFEDTISACGKSVGSRLQNFGTEP
ncbi:MULTISPECIES: hypothetical protein [Rhizobium]|uniref:Uncharacterized protein n=1 Tax=Rhizobium paranaense TaxID=1650438 RepID=A0A7W8XV36_9HYPH|nr:hypothetical protein [Rhizobium paranaense]MBB5576142.1 hypothetical protein [Rhizobium paranaense]